MGINRRAFVTGALTALGSDGLARENGRAAGLGNADHVLTIDTGLIQLSPETVISTRCYNGTFPGPLLRLRQGKRVTVAVENRTTAPEQLHWHGQFLAPSLDGAAEEGTPFIMPGKARTISFVPGPSGFRWYHSHVTAGTDLTRGLYGGLAGPVYIEPVNNPGAHDAELFLTLKEFGPYLNHVEMTPGFMAPSDKSRALFELDQKQVAAARAAKREPLGYELGYQYYAINGRMLGQGDPIRVKSGQRLLLHILNASATEIRSLALPGHQFRVLAMDGNPVPNPASVPVLWLGPGERICATLDMRQPGKWVLGDSDDMARNAGMGVVVEYAGSRGEAQWKKMRPPPWDYRLFARRQPVAKAPDETIEMVFATNYASRDGFNEFTINGEPFSMAAMKPRFAVTRGRRYRLLMKNATDDVHPLHLHRHTFEVSSIMGQPMSGLMKDVVMIGAFQQMTVDFTAERPGLSLFHCHMQSHMDYGFMALFDCR